MIGKLLPDRFVPKDIPKGLALSLIFACLFLGSSAYRYGRGDVWQGVLHVLETWLVLVVIIPACTTLVAMPIKYREPEFDVRLAYYLGMFVAFLFMFGKLRYWR